MGSGMFDGVGTALAILFVALIISLPLGIWKLIELVAWLYRHVTII